MGKCELIRNKTSQLFHSRIIKVLSVPTPWAGQEQQETRAVSADRTTRSCNFQKNRMYTTITSDECSSTSRPTQECSALHVRIR